MEELQHLDGPPVSFRVRVKQKVPKGEGIVVRVRWHAMEARPLNVPSEHRSGLAATMDAMAKSVMVAFGAMPPEGQLHLRRPVTEELLEAA